MRGHGGVFRGVYSLWEWCGMWGIFSPTYWLQNVFEPQAMEIGDGCCMGEHLSLLSSLREKVAGHQKGKESFSCWSCWEKARCYWRNSRIPQDTWGKEGLFSIRPLGTASIMLSTLAEGIVSGRARPDFQQQGNNLQTWWQLWHLPHVLGALNGNTFALANSRELHPLQTAGIY